MTDKQLPTKYETERADLVALVEAGDVLREGQSRATSYRIA